MADSDYANVNGTLTPLERAVVPVSDHGFLYGDSVYETVRTYDHRLFLLDRHLERLDLSARSIHLELPWSREQLAIETGRAVEAAVAAGAGPELAVRVMTTRGTGPLGYDPGLCPRPNLVIIARSLLPVPADQRETGIVAIVPTVRRNPVEALDPRIKSSNLLNNILAAHQARDAGAVEAILFNTSGFLAEGTLTNVFFVRGDTLRTPSLDCGILMGVTRDLVIELARSEGIRMEEGRYRAEDLSAADEIFVTSTTREILPVARLDGRPVGPGRRGPVTRQLQERFAARVRELMRRPTEPAETR